MEQCSLEESPQPTLEQQCDLRSEERNHRHAPCQLCVEVNLERSCTCISMRQQHEATKCMIRLIISKTRDQPSTIDSLAEPSTIDSLAEPSTIDSLANAELNESNNHADAGESTVLMLINH